MGSTGEEEIVELQFEAELDEETFTSRISSKHNSKMIQSTLAADHTVVKNELPAFDENAFQVRVCSCQT